MLVLEVWVNSSVAQIETETEIEVRLEGETDMAKAREEWSGMRYHNLSVRHQVRVCQTSHGILLLEMREDRMDQDGVWQETGGGMHQHLALEAIMIARKEKVVQQSISGSGKRSK